MMYVLCFLGHIRLLDAVNDFFNYAIFFRNVILRKITQCHGNKKKFRKIRNLKKVLD